MTSDTNEKQKKKPLRFSILYKKLYFIVLLSFLVTFIVYILQSYPFFKDIENRALDYRFRFYPLKTEKVDEVIMIAIDESSLRHFVSNRVSWPWPRDYYSAVIDYFKLAGAKGVLFDILFYGPDYNAIEFDEHFAVTMKETDNSLLSALMVPDPAPFSEYLSGFSVPVNEAVIDLIPESEGIIAPIEMFLKNTKGLGTVNIFPDNDGVIRRAPVFYRVKDLIIPQLSFSAIFHFEKGYSSLSFNIRDGKWFFNDIQIPVDDNGNYLINWYGAGGSDGVFQYYPFRSVIQSIIQHGRGEGPVLPLSVFKDKYIIIGATAPGLYDLKTTPVSSIHPGMEIWATILCNFINKDFVVLIPDYIIFLYLLLLSLSIMYVFVHNPLRSANIILVLIPFLVFFLPIIIWDRFRVNLNIVSPLMAVLFSYLVITTISYVSEGKSKREIKKAFSRYLHPQIIDRLMDNPDLVDLQGEEFEATMIFTDIYNFTDFSEKTDPKTLVLLLNRYFETFTANILDNDGMLDKFMGDGIMAVFGTPLQYSGHAYNACKSAIKHKKYWKKYKGRPRLQDYSTIFHVNTRIGINSGKVIAGNIGSVRRVDYTVIGDAVNLAARLESINKYYQTDIILSEFTYDRIKENFICRELDAVQVKGKNEPTRIYELLDFAGSEDGNYDWTFDYAEALDYYRSGNWDKAIKVFSALASAPLNDKPSKIMLDRCSELKNNPPKDWNGIYKWEIK